MGKLQDSASDRLAKYLNAGEQPFLCQDLMPDSFDIDYGTLKIEAPVIIDVSFFELVISGKSLILNASDPISPGADKYPVVEELTTF